jgi:hypothetical protein
MQENMPSTNADNNYFNEQAKVATGVTDATSVWRKRQIRKWLQENEGSLLPPLPLTKSQYGFDDTPAFTAEQMRRYAIDSLLAIAGKVEHGEN